MIEVPIYTAYAIIFLLGMFTGAGIMLATLAAITLKTKNRSVKKLNALSEKYDHRRDIPQHASDKGAGKRSA